MLQQFSLNIGGQNASDIPYASGTTAIMFATTGTTGMLFWNTTYSAWFAWITDRWQLIHQPDPRYGFVFYDDWTGSSTASAMQWATNAGTLTLNSTVTATSPGTLLLRQASAASYANLRSSLTQYLLGTMDYYFEACVQVPALATAGEDFSVAIGLSDQAAYDANGACTDGVFFTYNRAVNGANWITNTTSNTSNTAKNSSTAISAGTYYRLGIYINAGTSATFYVNGTAVTAAHTTNLPTGAGRFTGAQITVNKTAGTGNSDLILDYVYGWGFFNGQRVA